MQISQTNDTNADTMKVVIAWIGTFFGGLTLNQLVLGATLVFTLLQIFVLARKIMKGKA